jgi:hypothetical protein
VANVKSAYGITGREILSERTGHKIVCMPWLQVWKKADALEERQKTEIYQMLTTLKFGSWDYGWLTFFSPVSVFCNVVILLYNEKHIYFYRKECSWVTHKANLRHKGALLHCQGRNLGTTSMLGKVGTGADPPTREGPAAILLEKKGRSRAHTIPSSPRGPHACAHVQGNGTWPRVWGWTWNSLLSMGPWQGPEPVAAPFVVHLHLLCIQYLKLAGEEAPKSCVGGRRPGLKSCLWAHSQLREPGEPLGRC